MFSLICTLLDDWVNIREAGDLRRHRAHHDVIVIYENMKAKMLIQEPKSNEIVYSPGVRISVNIKKCVYMCAIRVVISSLVPPMKCV